MEVLALMMTDLHTANMNNKSILTGNPDEGLPDNDGEVILGFSHAEGVSNF